MRRRVGVSNKLGPIRIYLAHSSRDNRVSRRIAESLRSKGFHVWYDEWEIRVGDSITQKISRGLEQGNFLVAVLSKSSVKSRWVQKELSAALQIGLFVLPARIDGCAMPSLLRDTYYADFRKGFRRGFDELRDGIAAQLRTPKVPVTAIRKRSRPARPRIRHRRDIRKLVDSFATITKDRMKAQISRLTFEDKKRVILEIMDKLSLADHSNLPDLSYLFEALDAAIQENRRPSGRLFAVFIREFASRSLPSSKDALLGLLGQVSKYAELSEIRQTVSDQGLMNRFVSEFETSPTFARGALNSEIIAKLQPMLTRNQIERVVEAAIANNQIYDSWGAYNHLRRLFAICDKSLTRRQRRELQKRSLISKSP